MTKDSILALYGTPSHQPAIYGNGINDVICNSNEII